MRAVSWNLTLWFIIGSYGGLCRRSPFHVPGHRGKGGHTSATGHGDRSGSKTIPMKWRRNHHNGTRIWSRSAYGTQFVKAVQVGIGANFAAREFGLLKQNLDISGMLSQFDTSTKLRSNMLIMSRGLARPGCALAAMRSTIANTIFANANSAMFGESSIPPLRPRLSHAFTKEALRTVTAASSMPGPGPASAIALQQIGVQLPERCCGCGIRLQMSAPEAPGYFIVPAKLMEIAVSDF